MGGKFNFGKSSFAKGAGERIIAHNVSVFRNLSFVGNGFVGVVVSIIAVGFVESVVVVVVNIFVCSGVFMDVVVDVVGFKWYAVNRILIIFGAVIHFIVQCDVVVICV